MGQTGSRFSISYSEHRRDFYNNSQSSSFAQHLLDKAHSFGPINNIMEVLHHHKKGAHLNTIERFYIHKEHAAGNHLNDEKTIFPQKNLWRPHKTHTTPTPRPPKSSAGLNTPSLRTQPYFSGKMHFNMIQ